MAVFLRACVCALFNFWAAMFSLSSHSMWFPLLDLLAVALLFQFSFSSWFLSGVEVCAQGNILRFATGLGARLGVKRVTIAKP